MEKQLKCSLLLSLEQMALRRVAVLLWRDSDILASFSKFQSYEINEEWRKTIEIKIEDKVSKLELSALLKKQMNDIIRPIGLQIRRWKDCQENYLGKKNEKISLSNSEKLCWSTAGLIDFRKTAEELVRCDVLDVVQRYQLACINCLEDYIPLLWEKLPEAKKDYFYYKVLYKKPTSPYLHFCWPYILKGELSKLDYLLVAEGRNMTSFNQWAFEQTAEKGNKTAAEYFFRKLTHQERESSLMRTAHAVFSKPSLRYFEEENFSFVLSYLLSLMTPKQQMEILETRPVEVFLCFLDWPLQDLFLANAGLIWTYLPPSGYGDLLRQMADEFEHLYFPKLFQEFFVWSPRDLKKCFVDQDSDHGMNPARCFLNVIFEYGDSESIEVIFRNVDAEDRVKLVVNSGVFDIFFGCFCLNDYEWRMVEVFLREAMLSKVDGERVTEAYIGFLSTYGIDWKDKKFKRFFEFLDTTDAINRSVSL